MILAQDLIFHIVNIPSLHAKWLNTLSYLENCGARKIAACEHPIFVKEEMLKHAAEEFRHALHLKRQIEKVSCDSLDTYAPSTLLGGKFTIHYLTSLDLKTCRFLKSLGFSIFQIKEIAYFLVTYAIELRAEELYPIYDAILRQIGSPVIVKSILLEEKEHLYEMKESLKQLPNGFSYAEYVCNLEELLYQDWLLAIQANLSLR